LSGETRTQARNRKRENQERMWYAAQAGGGDGGDGDSGDEPQPPPPAGGGQTPPAGFDAAYQPRTRRQRKAAELERARKSLENIVASGSSVGQHGQMLGPLDPDI